MTPTETVTIMRQLNEWRRGADIDPPAPLAVGKAIDAAIEMIELLELAESSVAWHRRRWMALQMHQTKMREPERTMVCDILANGYRAAYTHIAWGIAFSTVNRLKLHLAPGYTNHHCECAP